MAVLILTCRCGQQMKVPEHALGKTGTCVGCGLRLKITKKNTQAPKPEPWALPVPKERLPASPLPEPTDSDPLPENEHEEPQEAKQGQERAKPAATLEAEGKGVVTMIQWQKIWVTVAIVVIGVVVTCLFSVVDYRGSRTAERTSHPIREPARSLAKPSRDVVVKGGLSHFVLDEDVYDAPVKTQVRLEILVSGQVSKPALETLLRSLYSSTRQRRGFKFHESPTHIFIYAYTSRDHAESGMGQWIAMLSRKGENAEPEIDMNDRQLSQVGARPEERFGLSEAKRKQIFSEIVKAEDRAEKEAEAKYPLSDPSRPGDSESFLRKVERYSALKEKLNEKYNDELAAQYGLTRQQLDEVGMEGMIKDWPFPRY